MNNKGQTLVIFIILIPILFMLLSLVVDVGMLQAEKNKLSNICIDSLENALSTETVFNQNLDEKIAVLIRKNINDINIDKIEINNGIIYLTISKEYKQLFSKIFKQKENKIVLSFIAYKDNDMVVVRKK